MLKVESLKSCIGILKKTEFEKLCNEIYDFTKDACGDYPNYKEWYFSKQIPRVFTSGGEILFIRDKNKIVAVSSLKKDDEERKLCTLYVSKCTRKKRIGTMLLEASMEFLGTTKPFITVADYKLPMFKSIINKYDWQLIEVVNGLYKDGQKELCFNGKLTKD
mgnify:FL=1